MIADRAEATRELAALVRDAVRMRLVSDVPLGALLSGGLDSSIVVATMAQTSSEPVRTFSVGFADARYDEREYARAVAQRYGTVHEELVLEPDALLERLDALTRELQGLNRRLDSGDNVAPLVHELRVLRESLQALAYAALGQQGPQVRRRRS